MAAEAARVLGPGALRLHLRETATTACVGPCGCVRPVCLVIEAAHIRDSPGIAEDACGDPFPAKLALIAKGGGAPWADRESGQLAFEPCLLLDCRQPVHAFGSHRGIDLVRC